MGDQDEDDLVDTEDDMDYIRNGWIWNKWEGIGDNKKIPSPKEDDHYNGCHGLKEKIS